jgi:hypothetical protein
VTILPTSDCQIASGRSTPPAWCSSPGYVIGCATACVSAPRPTTILELKGLG